MKSSNIMNVIEWTMYLVGCLLVLTGSKGDTKVSCAFMGDCILPCSFQGDKEITVHWDQITSGKRVHSFYDSQDHPELQDEHFKNRTSLFQDQISRGNASLQLMGVRVQDEGRYRCDTSTTYDNHKLFVNVTVVAPVGKVKIEKKGNSLTCSSERIYPKPKLTWTTRPPSSETLQNTTRVQQNEEQLYNISSSLILPDNYADLDLICTVNSEINNKTETWSQPNDQSHCDRTIRIIIIVVVVAAAVIIVAGASIYWKCIRRKKQRKTPGINLKALKNGGPHQGETVCEAQEEENETLKVDSFN